MVSLENTFFSVTDKKVMLLLSLDRGLKGSKNEYETQSSKYKMARSRSRSRDRNRRRHSSSDDSDYDRRKRSTKKKRRSSRSRSKSTESDRRRYRSKDSSRYRSGYDGDHSRSSSRSGRRDSKKRNSRRDRSRNRSPSDRSRTERDGARTERSVSREHSKQDGPKDLTEPENISARGDSGLSFKERVAKLASSSSEKLDDKSSVDPEYKIDSEKVAEIDSQGFHQQSFSSNAFDKSINRNDNDKSIAGNNAMDEHDNHADAIFGASSKTTPTALPKSTGSTLLNQDADDSIFGPILLIDQSKRTERWLEKLKLIRQRFVQQSV